MGIDDLEYDNIRRMGRFKGKNRPIELSFFRTRDKIEFLRAKRKLRELDGYKKVFINNARTRKEIEIQKKLTEFGKAKKAVNPTGTRFSIRNQTLELSVDGTVTLHRVINGTVVQQGNTMDISSQNGQGSQGLGLFR